MATVSADSSGLDAVIMAAPAAAGDGCRRRNRRTGLLFATGVAAAAGIYAAAVYPFIAPALRKICLPYVPATDVQVNNVFKVLEGRTGRLVDLGSGDGRLVLEAARRGFSLADGVELNRWLVWYSRFIARRLGLHRSTNFACKDLWTVDLSRYENVVIFGVDQMMADLEIKATNEMQKGGCLAVCRFPLPCKTPVMTTGSGIDTVWLYRFDSGPPLSPKE